MNRTWADTPRTLWVTTDVPDVCTLYRVWWPAMELSARGYIADYCQYGELNTFEPALSYGRYNTIVTPRMAFESQDAEDEWMRLMAAYPKIVWWYDCDDDLVTPSFVERMLSTHHWPEDSMADLRLEAQRASRVRLIESADAISVANPHLGALSGRLSGTPAHVIPNGINTRPYRYALDATPPRAMQHLTVGWSGGPRLERDLEPLYEVWPKLAELRPDVHFILQGWLPAKLVQLMPADRLHCIGGVSNERYPSILSNIDIFCCVTGDDDWNLSKTPIKWFEATLAGCACVVSDRLYGPAIDPPYAALVAHTPDEWLRALLAMVDDPQLRTTVHDAALQTVLHQHTLPQTYSYWLDAWSVGLDSR